MQCPWGLRGRNVIELSDVYICISPRTEEDWEEGPAGRRAYATKQAQLSAAEASRQLTGTSAGSKGGYGWSFLTWGGSILLNKLQFRVKSTHICFKVNNKCDAMVLAQPMPNYLQLACLCLLTVDSM